MQNSSDYHNIQAFLFMIRKSEGTAGPDGYKAIFGGHLFDSFEDHPKEFFTYTDSNGRALKTSAAGAYQITYSVWEMLKHRLDLPDFSPESQDIAAIELISEKGALDEIINGDFHSAIKKVKSIWASLPNTNIKQPEYNMIQAKQGYEDVNGHVIT